MVHLLIILCFAAIHLHDTARDGFQFARPSPALSVILLIGPLVLLWSIAQAFSIASGRRMDRLGDRSAAWRTERFMGWLRIAATAHFCACVLAFHWLDAVRSVFSDVVALDEAVALLPILVFFVMLWWSLFPLDRRIREATIARQLHAGIPLYPPRSRARFVIDASRHHLLIIVAPLLVMTAWHEVVARGGDALLSRAGITADWALPVLTLAGVIGVFLIMPPFLRRIWDTTPIEGGRFADAVAAMCRTHKVRLRRPLLWHTGGSMVNGAVLGMVWPFRYLLFTDALFDRLTPREAEAVAAHEIGHIRRRHIFWSVVFIAGVLLVLEHAAAFLAVRLGWSDDHASGISLTIAILLLAAGVFGYVSRRFEWQADAFAVSHLSRTPEADPMQDGHGAPAVSPPTSAGNSSVSAGTITGEAVSAMIGALRAVADVNGVPIDRFSFRHGSIAQRMRHIQSLQGRAPADIPIDRQVRLLKAAATLSLMAGVLLAVL